MPPGGESGGSLERSGWLTPYAAETIAEDALRAGHGTQLEVTVAASADDVELARVQHHFAWLGERDVRVTVRRDDRPVAHSAFTHRVLDQLIGAPTTVTVANDVKGSSRQ